MTKLPSKQRKAKKREQKKKDLKKVEREKTDQGTVKEAKKSGVWHLAIVIALSILGALLIIYNS